MALEPAEVELMVRRFLRRVRRKVTVTAAFLYGSYARGNPDDDSDIDLAVVSPDFGRDTHREMVLLSEACAPDALFVEATPFSADELNDPPRGSFLREIIKTGRRVA